MSKQAILDYAWYAQRRKSITYDKACQFVGGAYHDHYVTGSCNADYIYDHVSHGMVVYTSDKEVYYTRNFDSHPNDTVRANCIVYVLPRTRKHPKQIIFFGTVVKVRPKDTLEKGYVRCYDVARKSREKFINE